MQKLSSNEIRLMAELKTVHITIEHLTQDNAMLRIEAHNRRVADGVADTIDDSPFLNIDTSRRTATYQSNIKE